MSNNINKEKISKLMSTEVKSMVAKLLARENITIQRGNYETASFNLETRVLQLPLWDNISNDELDLFIGHEISHALNTPADAPHLFASKCKGIPFSVCNVIEDIRIEKMVQKEYPGLISSFRAGYTALFKKDFFQLNEIPMSERTLIDRINIKAKLGSLVDVPFEADEMNLVNMAFNCVTFDDVLDAVNAFKDELGDSENDQSTNSDDNGSDADELTDEEKEALSELSENYDSNDSSDDNDSVSDWSAPENDGDKTDSDADGNSASDSTEETDETSEETTSGGQDDGWQDDGTEAEAVESEETDSAGQFGVQSQKALEESLSNERLDKDLDEYDRDGKIVNFIAPSPQHLDECVISYEALREARLSNEFFNTWCTRGWANDNYYDSENIPADEHYRKFSSTSKKFINNLKMEFEMKKSAYQYTRATVSKTGKIDVNALHAYKYSEDIFNSVTTLADAKSHGMIFLVDMSGSMSSVIGTIYKQTINLAMFCKAVGIPFKVYGFTSCYADERDHWNIADGQFDIRHLHMVELLHSDLKKSAWKEALFHMFVASEIFERHCSPSKVEDLGGTPLGSATIALMGITKKFQQRHKIEKTSIMYLTDGAGHAPSIAGSGNNWYKEAHGKLNGKQVCFSGRRNAEQELVEHLKDTTGATLTHFFLVNNRYDTRGAGYRSLDADEWKDIRKTKIITRDADGGFDRVFIVKNDRTDLTESNDFSKVQTTGMSDNQIMTAFRKNQTSRKSDRIFVNKFMEMVA